MTQKVERRSYFRIKDIIGLTYSVIGEDESSSSEGSDEMEVPVATLLSSIDYQFNQAANTLWRENATTAEALGLLNRKISLLAAHLLQKEDDTCDSYEEVTASISGCGLAFHCAEPLPAGTLLRVSVVLKPSSISLNFTATVVACEHLSDIPANDYLMRVSIDEKDHIAREQLIQHVVQRQSAIMPPMDSSTGSDVTQA